MSKIFDLAHAFTAPAEGGLTEHKNDPGGITNYGVSLRFIKDEGIDIDGDGVISRADILAMTPGKAKDVFKRAFWDKLNLDALSPRVAIVTYDAAVNTGRTQTVKFLQRACNSFPGTAVDDDGKIGPVTRARVRAIVDIGNADIALAEAAIAQRRAFHQMLADNSPYSDGRDYRPFIVGWLNRCRALKTYIHGVEV
ncbi:MAG: hypothetical protein LBB60_10520 [Desulfovibrio sp.]|jgi:lysozyme family protein|nr:hypothetical protein [Desulfovibrio sp.]